MYQRYGYMARQAGDGAKVTPSRRHPAQTLMRSTDCPRDAACRRVRDKNGGGGGCGYPPEKKSGLSRAEDTKRIQPQIAYGLMGIDSPAVEFMRTSEVQGFGYGSGNRIRVRFVRRAGGRTRLMAHTSSQNNGTNPFGSAIGPKGRSIHTLRTLTPRSPRALKGADLQQAE
jgi:hypothetical protein